MGSPDQSPFLNVEKQRADGELTLLLEGELDLASAEELKSVLADLQLATGNRLVIDVSGLTFMDSTGLRQLLWAQQQSEAVGFELVVLTGESPVARVFELTRADRQINVARELT
jgi:anti-anti-sigma factor